MKKYGILLILFAGFLFFSIFRHHCSLSWDFCAYIVNAQHFFYGGEHFETVRPPLVPLLLAIFLPFGITGEYIYIILISGFFLYTVISLADYLFDQEDRRYIFYFFCLSSYALVYSFTSGSELLALALFGLFILNVMKGKISGHYLGLAFLTRYTFLAFLPFMFFSKSWKKIICNVFVLAFVISPWLLYNYSNYENPFSSMLDSYALNIQNRAYMIQPLTLAPILQVVGLFTPFFILGVGVSIINVLKLKKITPFIKGTIILGIVFVLVLIQFNGIPHKQPRYLFALILPIAFFSTVGFYELCNYVKYVQKYAKYVLLIWFILTVGHLSRLMYENRTFDDRFYAAATKIKELELDNRDIVTPYWVHMRYLTGTGNPIKEPLSAAIKHDKVVLIFKGINYRTIDDKFSLNKLQHHPILFETKEYILLGREPSLVPLK